MEKTNSYELTYHGTGKGYFPIWIVNTILTLLTVSLYYPWAKEKSLKYFYSQTTFEHTPFVFSGTGKEMFKGYLKALAIIIILLGLALFGGIIGALIYFVGIMIIMPLAIHGSYRYRMAKTSWRGIRFGYTGNRTEFIKLFFKGLFFTIISFGIYAPWFQINLRRYLIGHIKMGSAKFRFDGKGDDYFLVFIKGYILTLFTLGIYMFWWMKEQFDYFVNNLHLHHDEISPVQNMAIEGENTDEAQPDEANNTKMEVKEIRFTSKATAGGFFKLTMGNLLIFVLTLGLGYAWIITRNMQFFARNVEINGNISMEELEQMQTDYNDATGEDLNDFFDFGFVI